MAINIPLTGLKKNFTPVRELPATFGRNGLSVADVMERKKEKKKTPTQTAPKSTLANLPINRRNYYRIQVAA